MRGERRRYFRLAASIAPDWANRIDARGHVLGPVHAQVEEVSGGGARLRLDSGRLQQGHRLTLRFPLADEVFELTARVVWSDDAAADGTRCVGIAFEEVDAPLRRQIVAAMNEHRRRHEPQSTRLAGRLR